MTRENMQSITLRDDKWRDGMQELHFAFAGGLAGTSIPLTPDDVEMLRAELAAPQAELVEYVPPADVLLDQGITRLQLLSFLRGDDSDVWNGTPERTRWVRYRAHQITRVPTPDGHYIQIAYTDHDGTANDADWTIGGSDYDAYAVVRMVDFIIDAVIAEHGPDEILGGAA